MKLFTNGVSIDIDPAWSNAIAKQYYDVRFTLYPVTKRIWVKLISQQTGKTKGKIAIDLGDFREVMALVTLLCPQEE